MDRPAAAAPLPDERARARSAALGGTVVVGERAGEGGRPGERGDGEEPSDVEGKGQRRSGRIEVDARTPTVPPPSPDDAMSAERIQQALDANNGSIELTW